MFFIDMFKESDRVRLEHVLDIKKDIYEYRKKGEELDSETNAYIRANEKLRDAGRTPQRIR